MFCKYCGHDVGDTPRFCPKCGRDIVNASSSTCITKDENETNKPVEEKVDDSFHKEEETIDEKTNESTNQSVNTVAVLPQEDKQEKSGWFSYVQIGALALLVITLVFKGISGWLNSPNDLQKEIGVMLDKQITESLSFLNVNVSMENLKYDDFDESGVEIMDLGYGEYPYQIHRVKLHINIAFENIGRQKAELYTLAYAYTADQNRNGTYDYNYHIVLDDFWDIPENLGIKDDNLENISDLIVKDIKRYYKDNNWKYPNVTVDDYLEDNPTYFNYYLYKFWNIDESTDNYYHFAFRYREDGKDTADRYPKIFKY